MGLFALPLQVPRFSFTFSFSLNFRFRKKTKQERSENENENEKKTKRKRSENENEATWHSWSSFSLSFSFRFRKGKTKTKNQNRKQKRKTNGHLWPLPWPLAGRLAPLRLQAGKNTQLRGPERVDSTIFLNFSRRSCICNDQLKAMGRRAWVRAGTQADSARSTQSIAGEDRRVSRPRGHTQRETYSTCT